MLHVSRRRLYGEGFTTGPANTVLLIHASNAAGYRRSPSGLFENCWSGLRQRELAVTNNLFEMLCTLCGALLLPQAGGINLCSNSCCLANFSEERCPSCHQMAVAVEKISETAKMLSCKRQHTWITGHLWVGKNPDPTH